MPVEKLGDQFGTAVVGRRLRLGHLRLQPLARPVDRDGAGEDQRALAGDLAPVGDVRGADHVGLVVLAGLVARGSVDRGEVEDLVEALTRIDRDRAADIALHEGCPGRHRGGLDDIGNHYLRPVGAQRFGEMATDET